MKTRMLHRVGFACLLLVCAQGRATEPYQEYKKRVEASESLTALTDGLFGDSVSLFNGSTEFVATDIDVPGNNAIPVALRRRYAVEIKPIGPGEPLARPILGGAGNWDIDVPYITGIFDASYGWQGLVPPGVLSDKRCSVGVAPLVSTSYQLYEIWQGNTVHLPADGDRPMLLTDGFVPKPSDGQPHRWTTRNRDSFGCIPMKSGMTGEGFSMQTVSGLKYDFDVSVARSAGYLSYQMIEGLPGIKTVRSRVYLLASKVSDRFGNSVSYQYNGSGNPTLISSSDGRSISLSYTSGRLTSATSAGRTWTYEYDPESSMLATVTQPDLRTWEYRYVGDLMPPYEPWDGGTSETCAAGPDALPASLELSITHPSGATGTFMLSNGRMYRSGVQKSECVQRVEDGHIYYQLHTPFFFDVMALRSKRITGPGLKVPLVWTYVYGGGHQSLWGSHQPVPYPCTTCAVEKTVSVVRPDNTKVQYRFGFLYAVNEGRPLGESIFEADGTLRSSSSTVYLDDGVAGGQAFYDRFGWAVGDDEPSTSLVRPIVTQVTEQDGATFSMSVAQGCGGAGMYCFDEYGNPTKVARSSSVAPSLGRTEQTTYYHDTAKWLLGQVQSVTCMAPASCAGQVMSQTTYNATTALPQTVSEFGKLRQTLAYNADGTLQWVKDGKSNQTTLSGWKRGVPQAITYPATTDQPTAVSQSAVVDDNGWIMSIIDENRFATCYDYDPMGRIKTVTYPSESAPAPTTSVPVPCVANAPWTVTSSMLEQTATTANEYGIQGGHWKQIVSTGNARKITYFDAFWRPLVVESYDNANAANTRSIVVKRYDPQGRPEFESYPRRTLTDYSLTTLAGMKTTYDALGRVRTTAQDSDDGPLTTTTAYLSGFKAQVTDPRTYKTTTSYLAWDTPTTDYPVSVVQPEGVLTDITRDAYGKPRAISRHNADSTLSSTRSYVYDANQQLCKTIEPESGSTVMHYDAAGNLDWSAGGQALPSTTACDTASVPVADIITRGYDARNRARTLAFFDDIGDVTTTYAPDGQIVSASVNNGSNRFVTSNYGYNRRRLPTSERLRLDDKDWSIGYNYSALGSLAGMTYPDGLATDFTPNALGQATKVGGYALGVTYYPNGAINGFTYGNGLVHAMTQNVRQLPKRSQDSGGVLDDTYDYDQNGNVLAITDAVGAGQRGNRDMTYDGLNRLTGALSPMFVGGTLYTYDVLDNLRRVKAPGRDHTYSYNARWQLETVNNTGGTAVIGLGYDERGNLDNKNGQLFDFDHGNRLREVAGKETYQYDAQGRRVKATDPNNAGIYSFYGQDGALRFQRDERMGKQTDYVMLGGSLVAQVSDVVSPGVPSLTAPDFVTTGSYTVGWTTMAGASRYELQERAGIGSWSQVYSGTALSKAISGKASGTYSYQVRACNPSACGGWSAESTVSVMLAPSAAPILSAPATAANGTYTVSWTTSSGATRYELQERLGSGAWAAAYSGVAQSNAYTGKAAGSYSYQVRACNDAGCSADSAIKTVQSIQPPTATSTLTVPASNATGSYTVSWTAVASATSYTLEERAGGGAWTPFGANAGTSQAIGGRTNGSYSYRVAGCNSAGCGPVSAVKTVTVLFVPGVPTLSVPASSTTGDYTTSWTSPATATSFQLDESANNGAWATAYTGAALSKAITGKATGSYRYRVQACNASGCGAESAIKTISVLLAPAMAPTVIVPTSTSTGKFTVAWTTVVSAATYVAEELPPSGAWGQIYSGAWISGVGLERRTTGTWQYRVKACNSTGCSPYSAVKSVSSTAPPPPPVPTGLKAVQQTPLLCRISWNASSGATYYDLKASGTNLYSGAQTFTTHDATCPYPFAVRACNAVNCSAWSQ